MAHYELTIDGKKSTFDTYEKAMEEIEWQEKIQRDYDRVGQVYDPQIVLVEKTSDLDKGTIVWRNTSETPDEKLQRIVSESARRKGISEVEFLVEAQSTLETFWNDPNNTMLRALLFPNGKPSLAEFLEKLSAFSK